MADSLSKPVQVLREDVLAAQRRRQSEVTSLKGTAQLQKQP